MGHSTTRWTKFYPSLTPFPLEWTTVNILHDKGTFSSGSMGALAPVILKNRLLSPAIFGHFSTVGKIAGAK